MINYEKAKQAFNDYVKNYDIENEKVKLKIVHTYNVVEISIGIAKDLKLSNEDIELAKVIALLHDIGRFEQAKKYNSFDDYETIDHADYGTEILFKDGLIRNFIEIDIYDDIVKKSIKNHNKFAIEEELSEKELLHAKLIRDADKTDIFRVKTTEKIKNVIHSNAKKDIKNETISDKIYNDFMNKKSIINEERKTIIDEWISTIAFIFDYNFNYGLKYIIENNYINILIDRIDYQDKYTKEKMEKVREFAIKYINDRCF